MARRPKPDDFVDSDFHRFCAEFVGFDPLWPDVVCLLVAVVFALCAYAACAG